jgi:hypothetical protein
MCGPTHVAFVLLEAPDLTTVARFVFSVKMKQQIDTVPVELLGDTIATARAATAFGKRGLLHSLEFVG